MATPTKLVPKNPQELPLVNIDPLPTKHIKQRQDAGNRTFIQHGLANKDARGGRPSQPRARSRSAPRISAGWNLPCERFDRAPPPPSHVAPERADGACGMTRARVARGRGRRRGRGGGSKPAGRRGGRSGGAGGAGRAGGEGPAYYGMRRWNGAGRVILNKPGSVSRRRRRRRGSWEPRERGARRRRRRRRLW